MKKLRFLIALWGGKLALWLWKLTGHTRDDKPGMVSMRFCPDFLEMVKKPELTICVTGTNGKTTTVTLINDILKEDLIVQKIPSVTRKNFDSFIKQNNLNYNPKMEVVSHNLLTKLVESNFGVGVLTKEYIKDKLNNTLFEINIKEKIPTRKLGYATKKGIYHNFTTKKFIELLTNSNK